MSEKKSEFPLDLKDIKTDMTNQSSLEQRDFTFKLKVKKDRLVETFINKHRELERIKYIEERLGGKTERDVKVKAYLTYKKTMNMRDDIEKVLQDRNIHGEMLEQMTEQILSFHIKNSRMPTVSETERLKEIIQNTKDWSGYGGKLDLAFGKEEKKRVIDYIKERVIEKCFDVSSNEVRDLSNKEIGSLRKEAILLNSQVLRMDLIDKIMVQDQQLQKEGFKEADYPG